MADLEREIIVDGNNLLHRYHEIQAAARGDFDSARRLLARELDGLVGVLADRITLVYDGTTAGPAHDYAALAVAVSFAPARLGADAVIEQMVQQASHPECITVVTSDRGEQHAVHAAGGMSCSCESFLHDLRHARSARPRRPRPGPARGPTLGDYFPD